MSANAVGSQGSTGAINNVYTQSFNKNEYATNSFLGSIFDDFMDDVLNKMCDMNLDNINYYENDE